MDDAGDLAVIANNFTIASNLRDGFPHPYTIDDARKWIGMVLADGFRDMVFAIEYKGDLAGSISLTFKDDIYRLNGEIGYFIGEKYWGNGIATEAIPLITKLGFESFDLERIYAEPFAANGASRRVLEKSGYRLEANLRNYVIKNDTIGDSCIYAMLRSEYLTALK